MPQPPQRNIDLSRASTGGSAGQTPRAGRQAGGQSAATPYRAQRPANAALPAARNVYRSEANRAQTGQAGPPAAARPQTNQPAARGQAAHTGASNRSSAPTPYRAQRAANPAASAPAGARAPSHPSAQAAAVRAQNGAQQSQQRAQNGAPYRPRTGTAGTASSRRRGGAGTSRGGAQATRKKQKAKRRFLITLASICAVLVLCVVGLKIFLNSVINTGNMGTIAEEIKTPPQLAKDQMSLLVVGIDKTAYDAKEVVRDEIGQTDMLLYLRFNFKDNTLRMLQIPRDSFLGEDAPTGGTGKLNGLYKHGENQDTNRVNNVAVPVSELFQLPIDGYVAIDMISLREIVDVFGGIEVYVSYEHNYKGSYIPAGWQTLHGDMLEFFLRDRYSTPLSDIGRLDTQRYFYSALFRLLRTATWKDIVKLTPVAQNYVNTDLSAEECAALAIRMLKIPSSNIMMGRIPTYDSTENYNVEHAVQVLDAAGTADVLNEYFRTPETLVTAEQYMFADWPHAEVPHKANVQWMNEVDADGDGTVGEAAGGAQTGDDLLNPPASGSTAADSTIPAA